MLIVGMTTVMEIVAAMTAIAITATTGGMEAEEMVVETPEMEVMDRIATTEVTDRILKPHLR